MPKLKLDEAFLIARGRRGFLVTRSSLVVPAAADRCATLY